ncbi:hypothetical protein AAHC03_04568 [Spirometra sp. Aus1]
MQKPSSLFSAATVCVLRFSRRPLRVGEVGSSYPFVGRIVSKQGWTRLPNHAANTIVHLFQCESKACKTQRSIKTALLFLLLRCLHATALSGFMDVIAKYIKKQRKQRKLRSPSPTGRFVEESLISSELQGSYDGNEGGHVNYGKISFKNISSNTASCCRYLRLSEPEILDGVITLLTDYWKLFDDSENLVCLSFLGSVDEYSLEELQQTLLQLMIEVTKSKRLVIFCSGEDNDLTRTLGRALARVRSLLRLVKKDYTPPYFVGFLPWEKLKNSERFEKHGETVILNEEKGEEDDGTTEDICPYLTHLFFINESGGEIARSYNDFRHRLESRLAPSLRGSIGQILFGGDINTAFQVNPTRNLPLVVLRTSGGFADILSLSTLFKGENEKIRRFSKAQDDILYGMLAALKGADRNTSNTAYDVLVESVNIENFVFVHDLSQGRDISSTVLYALMTSHDDELCYLKLAIVWNRLEEFVQCVNGRSTLLDETLLQNRDNFIDELAKLDLETNLKVNLEDLRILYNRGAGTKNLCKILSACGIHPKSKVEDKSDSESEASDEERKDEKMFNLIVLAVRKVSKRAPKSSIYLEEVYNLLMKILSEMDIHLYKQDKRDRAREGHLSNELDEPLKHLFIWAVLMDHPELAKSLLQHCPNPTCMALIGSAIYDFCSQYLPSYNSETKIRYTEQAEALERIASQIASTVHDRNKTIALDLVNVPHDFLLGTNLLWVCRSTSRVSFGVTPPVQTTASMDWHNGINSSLPVFLLTLLCPLLLAIDSLQSWAEGPMDNKECSIEKANLCERMKRFYHSARAKQMLDFLVYLAFLIMLTVVVLVKDTTHTKGALEIYVMVHYMLLCLMDISSFLLYWHESSFSTATRSAGITSFTFFNYLTYVIFWIWFFLRVSDFDDLNLVEDFLVIFLILCYVRILEYLLVYRPFGPHIIIMKPMLQEFSIFLMVIVIVLVPQAIALQRLSFPYVEEFTFVKLLSSLEYPYYNLYGEIEPEGLSGTAKDCIPNGIDCPLANPMSNVIQVLYLFFALVLLINLLIAVFSEVFNRLSPKSLDLWRLHRLTKTQNYRRRSAIPKPYSIIDYAYKICKLCVARALNHGSQERIPHGKLSRIVINEKSRINFIESAVSEKLFQAEKSPTTALATITEINNLLKSKAAYLTFRMHQRAYAAREERRKLKDKEGDTSRVRRLLGVLGTEVSKEQQLCKSVRNIRHAFTSLLEEVKTMSNTVDVAMR